MLLLGGICAWSPRESASSLGFCGRQLPCAPHDRVSVLRRRVADEAQAATIAELTEKLSQPEDFEVGQNVSGRVMATQFRGPSLAYVDIGADKDAVLEYGEMEDGFPTKRDPVRKGKQISARILEFNEEADRFYLTMRSGDLSRPPRIKKSEENHDPESLRLVASEEWLDAEVLGIFTFGVFVNVTPSWGGGDPVFALLPKSEFSADFGSDPEKAIRGGKIKVRKLGLNDRGELRVTMKM